MEGRARGGGEGGERQEGGCVCWVRSRPAACGVVRFCRKERVCEGKRSGALSMGGLAVGGGRVFIVCRRRQWIRKLGRRMRRRGGLQGPNLRRPGRTGGVEQEGAGRGSFERARLARWPPRRDGLAGWGLAGRGDGGSKLQPDPRASRGGGEGGNDEGKGVDLRESGLGERVWE